MNGRPWVSIQSDGFPSVPKPARLGRISGGGACSDLWTQIIASVLELPVDRVQVDEGAAFGAAILGGVAAGAWPDVHAGV